MPFSDWSDPFLSRIRAEPWYGAVDPGAEHQLRHDGAFRIFLDGNDRDSAFAGRRILRHHLP